MPGIPTVTEELGDYVFPETEWQEPDFRVGGKANFLQISGCSLMETNVKAINPCDHVSAKSGFLGWVSAELQAAVYGNRRDHLTSWCGRRSLPTLDHGFHIEVSNGFCRIVAELLYGFIGGNHERASHIIHNIERCSVLVGEAKVQGEFA